MNTKNEFSLRGNSPGGVNGGLDPYFQARDIIRLIQCPKCSRPLRTPMRLPCGNSVCRTCLPQSHKRENITYPMTAGREEGFHCPFFNEENPEQDQSRCGMEHALGDCGVDVTLNRLMEIFDNEINQSGPSDTKNRDVSVYVESIDSIKGGVGNGPKSITVDGGRLLATYTLAQQGQLPYGSNAAYSSMQEGGDIDPVQLDRNVFDHLKVAVKNELDCQVCYALMLDPLTTSCGHTFCRACVARVVDHSNLCPICRRTLPMAALIPTEPGNKTISSLIAELFPIQLKARREAAAGDDIGLSDQNSIPLFVCMLSFPSMPTYLHVFEPRYRLMIRRALESGDGKFGMVLYNRSGSVQGELGATHFLQYGTLLAIDRFEMLPDGRSLISAVGVSRFKVVDWEVLDGYVVGKTERIDDIPIGEEESREAMETASAPSPSDDNPMPLGRLSTQQLLQLGLDYVAKRRAERAPWLHNQFLVAYGQPPSDPALFPYWFASVLPISEDQKYTLLSTTSVRERLKITARWVEKLESTEWKTASSGCTIL